MQGRNTVWVTQATLVSVYNPVLNPAGHPAASVSGAPWWLHPCWSSKSIASILIQILHCRHLCGLDPC